MSEVLPAPRGALDKPRRRRGGGAIDDFIAWPMFLFGVSLVLVTLLAAMVTDWVFSPSYWHRR